MITSTLKEMWRKLSVPAPELAAPVTPALVPVVATADGGALTTQPAAPAYDLSLLQGMVGEDSPALREIVQKFIRDTPAELERLERAVAAYDLPAVGAQAHRLKSQVKLFGLEKAAVALHKMEQIGKGQLPAANPAVLQQHAEEVKAVYEGATRELSRKYGAA
jgi:HPt (histidine-containing phosphotransfer) domain-containing protein